MGPGELERGLRLFQAGKLDEAADAFRRHLESTPEDSRALHLLGRALLKAGRADDAASVLQKASSADPRNLQVTLALGSAERATGRVDRALAAFRHATTIAPESAVAWFDLGLACRDQGRLDEAVLAFRRAATLDPGDFDATQNIVTTLAMAVRSGQAIFPPAPRRAAAAGSKLGVSLVVCTVDEARLRRFAERMEPHVRERPHELVVVRDAASLCEGYRRGWEHTSHPLVVFCHDDIWILSADPFGAVEAALGEADIVGLAGSALASGPAVLWAGHPHIHGWITHAERGGDGLRPALLSLRSGVLPGMQALDGVFMAMRREVPARVGFDESTFDGFHFYDLDFTYRAARAGLRLAVTTDVVAVHESTGKFDARFAYYAQRFRAKFPELSGPRGPNHWYEARFGDAAQVLAFYEALRGLVQQP